MSDDPFAAIRRRARAAQTRLARKEKLYLALDRKVTAETVSGRMPHTQRKFYLDRARIEIEREECLISDLKSRLPPYASYENGVFVLHPVEKPIDVRAPI